MHLQIKFMKMVRKINNNFEKSQYHSWLFYYEKIKGVFQWQNDKQYESNGKGGNTLYS